jgi:hypothetical protein
MRYFGDNRTIRRVRMYAQFFFTLGQKTYKRSPKFAHSPQATVKVCKFHGEQFMNANAFDSAPRSAQRAYLIQGEAQFLCLLDESQTLDHRRRKQTVATLRARRGWQKAATLVIPDRVDSNVCLFRKFADAQSIHQIQVYTLDPTPESSVIFQIIQ